MVFHGQGTEDIPYRTLMDQMPEGLSYNRIIFDQEGNPADFIFLYINYAFEKITGLKKDQVVNKQFSEIISNFSPHEFGWLSAAGKVALTGEPIEMEYYSQLLDKWILISLYSTEKGSFTLLVKNVTESKQKYLELRKILDFSPDFIIVTDLVGNITECNNRVLEELCMSSRESILGSRALDLFHPNDRQRAFNDMKKIITAGHVNNHSYLLSSCRGRQFPCEMSISLVRDHLGRPSRVIGIAKDITERKIAEQALKSSEEKFYKAFHSSPASIAISVLDTGVYLEVNNTFLEAFGFERDEVIGSSSFDLNIWVHPEDRTHFLQILQSGGTVKNIETLLRIKSGEIITVLLSLVTINLNGVDCLIFSLKDITARKKAEEELKASEEKLRSIFSSSPDGIVVTTLDGKITECNHEMLRLFDINKKSELIGTSLFDYVLPSEHKKVIERKGRLMHQGAMKNGEYTVVTRQGRCFIAEASTSLIRNSLGEPEHIVTICKDITERKKVESEIKYLSYHDKMTGLYNRAFFEQELERLDKKGCLPLSVIVGDLNGLKLTNDVFGHYEGDKLLQKVAGILTNSCRSKDIICRWGGDEFAVILPYTSQQEVIKVCELITRSCSETTSEPIQPSFALGYATRENIEQDIHQIIKEAENWMYRHKLLDSRSVRSSIIASLQKTLFERNFETQEHAQRMRLISIEFGKALLLSSTQMDELSLLAILHDIGKIAVPDHILVKPGKLTEDEWDVMKKHTEIGYRIAKSSPELSHIAEYILTHHERWDGKGFPQGLKGKDIPVLSRIIAIVDAYDVMTHVRPYKGIMSYEEAIKEIRACSGKQFDPVYSEIFIQIIEGIQNKGI